MGRAWADGGYSSDVSIFLHAHGAQYDVAQIGPETLILRGADSPPPGPARIEITIDGRREVLDVIVNKIGAASGDRSPELSYA